MGYTARDLLGQAKLGGDSLKGLMAVVRRRIGNPSFEHKRPDYELKLAQLEGVVEAGDVFVAARERLDRTVEELTASAAREVETADG